jgi:hypothetical protein
MIRSRTELEALVSAEFGPLRRAERLVARAFASGEIAKIGLRRPNASTSEVSVRAAVLAYVLRSGLPLHGRRLQVIGAFVEGRLDLGDAAIQGSVWFYRCHFDSPVLLDGSTVAGAVTLGACHLPGLLAEGCTISKGLYIHAGTRIANGVRLRRARIGGDLDCSRLDLRGLDGMTSARTVLVADGAHIGGDVRLADGFQAVGEVRFVDATVEGDFVARGHFNGCELADSVRDSALVLDRIEVGGSVRLDGGFSAAGRVSLCRARVGGDVDATGANFDWVGDAAWGGGPTLALDRARVDGALVLRELQSPLVGASFVDARVGALTDDTTTWGDRLALDGFRYSRFGDGAPLDTVFRLDWLEMQSPAHLRGQFRVQPWRRAIRVLRRMGRARGAGSIALRRERWLRRTGAIGASAPPALRWLPRAGHWLFGVLAGHGYRPGRLLAWLGAVWLLCAGVYWADAAANPLAHSLDRLLPFVGLPLADEPGAAAGELTSWVGRLEATFGWTAGLTFLASMAGWLDRDRRR